jgi:trimethylamine-N-oxide reductase cytochrome c-type subunit TorC
MLERLTALWRQLCDVAWAWRVYILVAVVSLTIGLGVAAVYGTVVDKTETLAFCANACHEMHVTVYAEYTHTAHFKNAQGVVVTCADCHIPRGNWPAAMLTKIAATSEIWHHIVDRDALKRFNAHRPELEKAVLAGFAATNASACKSCHVYANMVLADQNPAARAMHARAMKTDANCLDCHKGVAHVMVAEAGATAPAGSTPAPAQSGSAEGRAIYAKSCAACHNAMEPKLGDKAAWAPLLKQGDQALVAATIHGKGIMPARGGNASLSDADIKAAVGYMTSTVR